MERFAAEEEKERAAREDANQKWFAAEEEKERDAAKDPYEKEF